MKLVNRLAPSMLNPKDLLALIEAVETWFAKEARDLPWRTNRSPYRVWVSEIMLQQTQVVKVIDYFNRFMTRFKSIEDLAKAPKDEVLSYWTGLGYYSRCLNLHKAAQQIVESHDGEFPSVAENIAKLPGVGSYTSGAIRTFAFNQVAPVVDGNIARVLSRLYADETAPNTPNGKKHFEAMSLAFAKASTNPAAFHEGIMEIGATLCKPRSPSCDVCPINRFCAAHARGNPESFPTKEKKVKRKELHVVFAVVGDDENVWLERNEKSRLFNNLYAPPHATLGPGEDPQGAFQKLSQQHELGGENMKTVSLVRQLTHRIFHMHGFVIKASPAKLPHGNWIRRSDLSKVGLSSSVKALLEKAHFLLLFALFFSGCAHTGHKLVVREKKSDDDVVFQDTSTQKKESAQDENLRKKLVECAKRAIGKKRMQVGNQYFRRDCSGTVRGIFAHAGLTLKDAQARVKQTDSKTLMDFAENFGSISSENPRLGDLVFFHNTYDVNRNGKMDDGISHVGIVTGISESSGISYVHYSRGRIMESKLDDMLRRPRRKATPKTGLDLFSGYGTFDLNELVD